MDKSTLRAVLKERRAAMSPDVRAEKSRSICKKLFEETAEYSVIMAYAPKEPEVDTMPFIEELIAAGKTVVLPIIERETHTLRLSVIEDTKNLECSTFNVPEPVSAEIPISGCRVECVVLPMVGFDRRGNRLGYGAGYYDRFLEANPGVKKIGAAFSSQEAEMVPAEAFDVRMDEIVTEDEIILC